MTVRESNVCVLINQNKKQREGFNVHFKQGGFDRSGNDTPNAGSSLEKYISCVTLGEKDSKLGGGNGFALEKNCKSAVKLNL